MATISDGEAGSSVRAKLNATGLCVNKLNGTAAPTVNDDSANTSGNGVFGAGSLWCDVTDDAVYVCIDPTATSAIWVGPLLEVSDLTNYVANNDQVTLLDAPVDCVLIGDALGDVVALDYSAATTGQTLTKQGDGTIAWQTPAGGGNVSNSGTPVDNQVAIWTSSTAVEGQAALTFNSATPALTVAGDILFDADGTRDVGDTTNRIGTLHVDAIDLNGTTIDGASIGTSAIEYVIDGGGSAITTGVKGVIEVPFACTITQVTLLADQSGSIVIDIWKDTYANYPPTVADTITAAAKPTLSSAVKSQDATLTGWTTTITAGDILRFNVDSATTVERVTISLKIQYS